MTLLLVQEVRKVRKLMKEHPDKLNAYDVARLECVLDEYHEFLKEMVALAIESKEFRLAREGKTSDRLDHLYDIRL